jgi:hypothetical protein
MASANRLRGLENCREWNKNFKIGTKVTFEGKAFKTWSYAGLGLHDEPAIWLEGVDELVPLSRLDVPGFDRVKPKRNSRPEDAP